MDVSIILHCLEKRHSMTSDRKIKTNSFVSPTNTYWRVGKIKLFRYLTITSTQKHKLICKTIEETLMLSFIFGKTLNKFYFKEL